MLEVLYSAAHAEFPDTEPLGGGKAVSDYLIREWQRERPFPLTVFSPKSLKLHLSKPLVAISELEYARFCRDFVRAATAEILKFNPHDCIVLSNDISEGPDIAALGKRGYRIVTIFHVDVVEYFTKFYLRNLARPEWLAKFRWFGLLPDVLRLVFQKQFDCVRHSARIIVPSAPMHETIRRCYPWCPAEKITVLPWGNVNVRPTVVPHCLDVGDDEFVIMTLSRLSPEKGIERLLAVLPFVTDKPRVFICGAPTYMKGTRYERKLRRMANGRVAFLGHVTGARKASLLRRADLFVSPSRHESYGLTIAEAQAAGCRVISHNHYGASGQIVDCSNPAALAGAINAMIAAGRTKKPATAWSSLHAAQQLAALLLTTATTARDL